MITHIVLVKFNPSSTKEQRLEWRSEITKLEQLPQVKDLRVGDKVSLTAAKGKDGGWEDGAVMTFDTLEDVATYATSSAHDQYLAATAAVTADKLIYDIQS